MTFLLSILSASVLSALVRAAKRALEWTVSHAFLSWANVVINSRPGLSCRCRGDYCPSHFALCP